MYKLILAFIILCFSAPVAFAQTVGTIGTSSNVFNTTCGATVSTLLPYNGTTVGWSIHPENGNIRISIGNSNGDLPPNPTSTTGLELVASGYYANSVSTPPTAPVLCISESGTTINVSGTRDSR